MAYNPRTSNKPLFTIEHPEGIKVYLVQSASAYDVGNRNILYTEFGDGVLDGTKSPQDSIADILIEMAEGLRRYRPTPGDEFKAKRLK